jgi:hypothetical protein
MFRLCGTVGPTSEEETPGLRRVTDVENPVLALASGGVF